jgi:hypothetical protein
LEFLFDLLGGGGIFSASSSEKSIWSGLAKVDVLEESSSSSSSDENETPDDFFPRGKGARKPPASRAIA